MNFRSVLKISILLLLLPVIFACKKNKPKYKGDSCTGECYQIEGKVVETSANKPLNNVQLRIYHHKLGVFGFGSSEVLLGRIYTDPDGSFKFSFDAKNRETSNGYYYIEADLAQYLTHDFMSSWKMNPKELIQFKLDSTKINKRQKFNILLYQKATLNLNVKVNTPSLSTSVFAGIKFDSQTAGTLFYVKKKIDTTLKLNVAGNAKTYVIWQTKANGVTTEKIDSVIVPGGGERNYSIILP